MFYGPALESPILHCNGAKSIDQITGGEFLDKALGIAIR